MTAEPTQLQSIFPDLPREIPVIDKETGDFNSLWSLGISSLFQALQENFKNEGILFPSLSATNIANIQSIYTPLIGMPLPQNIPDISGQTVFDTTNRVPKQFIITYDGSTPPIILSASWLQITVMIVNSINPNWNSGVSLAVAGVLNWLCYDMTGMHLWICTTSGGTGTLVSSTGVAVWTQII